MQLINALNLNDFDIYKNPDWTLTTLKTSANVIYLC